MKYSCDLIRHAAGVRGRLVWHDVQHKVHTKQHMDSESNCAGLVGLQWALLELVCLLLAVVTHLANFAEQHEQQ